MERKVRLSTFCTVITLTVIIALTVGIFVNWNDNPKDSLILFLILAGIMAVSMFYRPLTIKATDNELIIHRMLKNKTIPYSSIKAASRFYPSPGGLRLCGSGGFFGYWGYFTDIVIGSYFGYFGKRSQCIVVELKNGPQYVISCEQPDEMLYTISRHI